MGTPNDWHDWNGAHYSYVQEEVRRRHPLSAAFTIGEPSLRNGVEPNQYLYRVERIDALLRKFGPASGIPIGVAEVKAWISAQRSIPATTPGAASSPAAATLREPTDVFNDERKDGRPAFVAFAAEFSSGATPRLGGTRVRAMRSCAFLYG